MNFCSVIVRDWKTNIKIFVGILNLFSIVFILTMPTEARDYHIRASDGDLYAVTFGEKLDVGNFSVQKSGGEILLGVTEVERAMAAELYFASIFLSDVLPFYEPDDGRSISPQEVLEVVQGALEHQDLTQIATVLGSFAVGYLIPDLPIPPTVANLQELNGVTGDLLSRAVLLDAGMLAVECAVEVLKHEDLLRNLWLSYETQSTIISIDEINTAFESFYKASLYNSRITELINRYFITSIPGALLDFTLSIVPIVSDIKNSISATYNAQHLEDLRNFANYRDKLINAETLTRINKAKNQSRIRLEQASFFQPVITHQIRDIRISKDNLPQRLNVQDYFSPSGTDNLTYIGRSDDLSVAIVQAERSGSSVIIITPKDVGTTSVKVQLINIRGLSVTQSFMVTVENSVQQDRKQEENAGDRNPNNEVANGVGGTGEPPVQDEPPDNREPPDPPDLVVTNIAVDPDTVHPGERFRVSATVENMGRGRNVSVRFYLSSDSTYSMDDEEITGWHRSLGVLRSRDEPRNVHANLDAPIEPGAYYYIVRVDTARDEIKTANNSDSIKITVLPPAAPDLVVSLSVARTKHVEWLSATEGVVDPDKFFRLDATIVNQGQEDSLHTTTVRFYRSSDTVPSLDDEEIAAETVKKLRDGSDDEESENGPAPSEPGVYYYFACVDSVPDERNTDNNCSNVVKITVRGPDLIVNSIWPVLATRKDTLNPNGIFEIYATVRNQGTEDASSTTLRYYHSSDAIISTDDTPIDEGRVYSLDINQTSKTNESRWIYAPYAAGIYYYYACVDIVEDETHKDNNCSEVISVTVRNIAPQKKDSIATQTLQIGTSRTIDVSDYFSDANKDSLTYDPRSNDISVVTLNQTDAKVTINPIGAGDAIVTVVASDGELTAKQIFSVSVSNAIAPTPNPDEPNAPDLSSEVFIPDANLRAAVRSQLGLAEGDILTQQEMQKLTTLKTSDSQIEDLTGLEHAIHLTELSLTGTNQFGNITPLASLTALTDLHFSVSRVSDLSPLASLTALTRLDIRYSPISDLSPLASLTALTNLYFEGTNISDLGPLTGLTALTSLTLDKGQVSDISPLGDLTALTNLNFYSNQITDISALRDLKGLRSLSLRSNQVTDINPIRGLAALRSLSLRDNQITDISALVSALRDLTALRSLNLRDNQITDISMLRDLTALRSLNLRDNQITDVIPLANLTTLIYLSLEGNPIADFAPLRKLREKNPSMFIDIDINVDPNNAPAAPAAPVLPAQTVLLSNYPNPFNPETWIPYQLAKAADVTLTIYAADGTVIRTLSLGQQATGIYQNRSRAAYWDGRNALGEPVASGVYFYTLTAGDFTATRKMLIRK